MREVKGKIRETTGTDLKDFNNRTFEISIENNEGKLDGHLATEDGMHLSLEGSMILLNYVLTHVPAEQQ